MYKVQYQITDIKMIISTEKYVRKLFVLYNLFLVSKTLPKINK